MTFTLTKGLLALVLISLLSTTLIAFMTVNSDYYGVTVPAQYENSFDNFNELQADYGTTQDTIQSGEVDTEAQDIAIFKNVITAVKQLANITTIANNVLADLAKFLRIPQYWVNGFFLLLGILVTASIIAFFGRGSKP